MTDPTRAAQARAPHGTAAQYSEAQVREWGTYTALVPIDFYGQRAYNIGDPVPESAVVGDAAWIDEAFVAQTGTPFEGSATSPPPGPPAIDPAAVGAPPVSTPDAGPITAAPDPGSIVTSSEEG